MKDWAADDRLWTTQETVEFNLRTFARTILAQDREALRLDRDRLERVAKMCGEQADHANAKLIGLRGSLQALAQQMREQMGPSWPPNFTSGERVAGWAKELQQLATGAAGPLRSEDGDL